LDVLACDEYTSPSGMYTWGENGVYQDTLSNVLGCDSLITINLSFSEIDTTVVQDENLLTALSAGLSYQWYECGEELVPIEGETAQSFEATESGSYAVGLSDGTCELLSSCTTIVFDNVNELEFSEVLLFPNPTNDRVTLTNLDESMSASVFNSHGQLLGMYSEVIAGQLIIDTQNYAAGIYVVHLSSAENSIGKSFRLVKL
ncbi:MAG: T9SS type A sorting domain-containing protein, partial [Flavobacteriales bacterium]